MPRSLIALGSNLGDRAATLSAAVKLLAEVPATTVLAVSDFHASAAVGGPANQGDFLNAAALVETALPPGELFDALGEIEQQLGRTRFERWTARTIDVDLVLYDDRAIDEPRLAVPHPRMAWRRFVLAPAVEVAPRMLHPRIGWTIEQLLANLDRTPRYLAIAGVPGAGKSALAAELVRLRGGRLVADPCPADALPAPGPATACEIEFVGQRAGLLAAALRDPPAKLLVSDFWIGQSIAYARALLGAAESDAVTAAIDLLGPTLPRPTLVVVRTMPHESPLQAALLELAQQPLVGPVLVLPADQPHEALHQIAAAVDAMQ